jgi:hypothetical protein
VQVKGGTYVESIGFAHRPGLNEADCEYDLLLLIDIGVTLDGDVGRLVKHRLPVKPCVDYYIVPNEVVRRWVREQRYVNGKGVHIYLYKYRLTPGTQEERGQTFELAAWRDRFNTLIEIVRQSMAVGALGGETL